VLSTQQLRDDGWSKDICEFFDHWRELRGDALVPDSSRFLDTPSFRFMNTVYICDVVPGQGAIVRFHGTELVERWGADFTGKELHAYINPEAKKSSLSNMENAVRQPCGYLVGVSFVASSGRALQTQMILLPLAAKDDHAPRVVGYPMQNVGLKLQEAVNSIAETHNLIWLDIGAGVPDTPPLDVSSK